MLVEQLQGEMTVSLQLCKRKRKSVRIAEEFNTVSTIPSLEDLSIAEMGRMWYTVVDFKKFKNIARMICQQSRSTSSFPALLSESYESSQPRLDLWAVHARSQRGLESWVALAHGRQRRDDRIKSQKAVLEAQKRLFCAGIESGKAADIIYKVSARVSGPSREFATRMGFADFHAVQQATDSQSPQRRASHLPPRHATASCSKELKKRPSQRIMENSSPNSLA